MTGAVRKQRRSLGTILLNAPYLLWAALFIIIPLFIVLYYALSDGKGGFTLSNLAQLGTYWKVALRSLWYSVLATAVSLLIAFPFAYTVSKFRFASQKIANMFVTIPMWINLLIRTKCLTALMESEGLINHLLALVGMGKLSMLGGAGAVIFGMVYNYLPYMILPIYNVMCKIDPLLLEASEDLGCSPFQRLRRVILPLSMPGIISGVIMVFVPSVSTFYISKAMGGAENTMIGDLIETQIHEQTANLPVAAALSLILMVVVLLSTLLLNRFSSGTEDGGMLV